MILYKKINRLFLRFNIIITFIILFLFTFHSDIFSQNMWSKQSSPTTKNLVKCSFPDSLHCWAAGDSGIIINTTNGGFAWNIQNSGVLHNIDDIFFLNSRLGWAIQNDYGSWGSVILSTTNGGLNWSNYRYPDTNLFLITIKFLDSLNGYMGGYGGVILKTTNGGVNWNLMQVDSSMFSYSPVRNFEFYSSQYMFACGGTFDIAAVVWKSINNGMYWTSQAILYEPMYDLVFLDSLNMIGVGGDYEYGMSLAKTSDGGNNWDYIPLNFFGIGYTIVFRTTAEAWIPLSFSATWALSTDRGNNWHTLGTTDSSAIYDVKFTDSLHGWAVGEKGVILKYNSSFIGINSNTNSIATNFNLYQNYPNPFNPNTTIKYYLSKPSFVRLRIYDVSGREVKNIFDSHKSAGAHIVQFDCNGLASGVYFYSLETIFGNMTKKMLIVK
jgi:photosystem II stability/assembly factor-like uncharacterized protein